MIVFKPGFKHKDIQLLNALWNGVFSTGAHAHSKRLDGQLQILT